MVCFFASEGMRSPKPYRKRTEAEKQTNSQSAIQANPPNEQTGMSWKAEYLQADKQTGSCLRNAERERDERTSEKMRMGCKTETDAQRDKVAHLVTFMPIQ